MQVRQRWCRSCHVVRLTVTWPDDPHPWALTAFTLRKKRWHDGFHGLRTWHPGHDGWPRHCCFFHLHPTWCQDAVAIIDPHGWRSSGKCAQCPIILLVSLIRQHPNPPASYYTQPVLLSSRCWNIQEPVPYADVITPRKTSATFSFLYSCCCRCCYKGPTTTSPVVY